MRLRENFAWTMAGNFVYAACQWGILILIAKMGSPELVGMFSLALAICNPIFIFTNLQLRAIQATDALDEHPAGIYQGLRVLGTSVGMVTAISIAAFYPRDLFLVIIAVAYAKGTDSLADMLYGFMQRRERLDRSAQSMMLKGVCGFCAASAVLWATQSLPLAITAMGLSWTLVMLNFDRRNAALIHPTGAAGLSPYVERGLTSGLFKQALPLGFVMMLITLSGSIPRYFIEHWQGGRELGFFAASAYIVNIGIQVTSALGQSASPRLAQLWALGKKGEFERLLLKLLLIAVGLGALGVIGAYIGGGAFLRLAYTQDYVGQRGLLTWIMASAALQYFAAFLGVACTAARALKGQVIVFMAEVLGVILFSALWVPSKGSYGAVLATGSGMAIRLLGLGYLLRRRISEGRP